MEKDKSYTVLKNLDLKKENFIVKKGTNLIVSNVFNKTDEDIATIIDLKFDNINGNYNFKESEFQLLVSSNLLTENPNQKFKNDDCVIYNEIKGRIYSASYITLGGWLYKVILENSSNIQVFENQLTKCS